ncbi:UNVERIFIED_CONTAM: hypothetical protein GTU68_022645 [Idotea baltica]|nr:hypothetical protein [Idotea baltica]
MFVFFAAKLGGEIQESTYRGAALVELLHTATLVHDDVVDDAPLRRGFFSVNALWKNKIAVLVGDYLLSKGLLLALDHKDYNSLHFLSDAVRDMSEGELLQMEKSRSLDITESTYFDIIRQKTASLIVAACSIGFGSTNTDETLVSKIKNFGEKTGLAFQIRDDLFDYGHGSKIGKPTGIDIKERKMTLPLIYALQNCTAKEKKVIIGKLKQKNLAKPDIQYIIEFVKQSGGIEYTYEVMRKLRQEALDILHEFPEGEARTGLESLIYFTTERLK